MAAPSGPLPDEGIKPAVSANVIDDLDVDTASQSWIVFDAWLEAELEVLEDRFCDFQTRKSLRVSLSRSR